MIVINDIFSYSELKSNCIIIKGQKLKFKENAYNYPTESSTLNIFEVKQERDETVEISVGDVKCKCSFDYLRTAQRFKTFCFTILSRGTN